MSKAYREFWINEQAHNNYKTIGSDRFTAWDRPRTRDEGIIHVIERQALTEAEEKIQYATDQWDYFVEELRKSQAEADAALALLRECERTIKAHHDWQNEFGKVPESFVGMDLSAEYSDSSLCDKTCDMLAKIGALLKGEK
jgi:hypothetical protein